MQRKLKRDKMIMATAKNWYVLRVASNRTYRDNDLLPTDRVGAS